MHLETMAFMDEAILKSFGPITVLMSLNSSAAS